MPGSWPVAGRRVTKGGPTRAGGRAERLASPNEILAVTGAGLTSAAGRYLDGGDIFLIVLVFELIQTGMEMIHRPAAVARLQPSQSRPRVQARLLAQMLVETGKSLLIAGPRSMRASPSPSS